MNHDRTQNHTHHHKHKPNHTHNHGHQQNHNIYLEIAVNTIDSRKI